MEAYGLQNQAMANMQGMAPPPEINPQYMNAVEDEDSPLFKEDDFRIWCMKVIPCTKRFVHDWTVCPFAHAGEKAVRRDPRTNNYTGIACPDMKKNTSCIRGDRCPYAHNVFEYWLHPTRYRTQLCNDGPTCRRSICFFAHSLEQLRVPACKPYVSPEALARASLEAIHNNPHPLGAQLPNAFSATTGAQGGGMIQGNGMSMSPQAAAQAAAQQAAIAAMNGLSPEQAHAQLQVQTQAAAMALLGNSNLNGPDTPPYGQHVPRMSEYGSLPRWSDTSTFAGRLSLDQQSIHSQRTSIDYNYPGSNRVSQDHYAAINTDLYNNAGRISAGNQVDVNAAYGSLLKSVPENHSAHMSVNYATLQGVAGMQNPTPRNSAGAYPVSSVRRSGSYPDSLHNGTNEGSPRQGSALESNPSGTQFPIELTGGMGINATQSDNGSVASTTGTTAKSPPPSTSGATTINAADVELAQSLASLKIAMTQQNIASSAGTNHEIVISTLHQILRDAVAAQGGTLPANITPEYIGNSPAAAMLAQSLLGGLNLNDISATNNTSTVPSTATIATATERPGSLDIASTPSLESEGSGGLLGHGNVDTGAEAAVRKAPYTVLQSAFSQE